MKVKLMSAEFHENASFGVTLANPLTPDHTITALTNVTAITLNAGLSPTTSLLSFENSLPAMAPSTGVTLPSIHQASVAPALSHVSAVQTHMSIVLDFVPATGTFTPLSATMQTLLTEAANYLGSQIADPVTVTLAADGYHAPTAGNSVVLASGRPNAYYVPYQTVVSELQMHDPAAAKYLPANLPAGVAPNISVSKAEEQAWGITAATQYSTAGTININTSFSNFYYGTGANVGANQYDLFGIALHEITHALGRVVTNDLTTVTQYLNNSTVSVTGYPFSVLDLFRFTAPGQLQIDGVSSPTNTIVPYFSTNGGQTTLATFAAVGRADWGYIPPATQTLAAGYADSFNGGIGTGYPANKLTPLDRTVMNALGFDINCFAAGTRILTIDGEKPVETLTKHETIIDINGNHAPIRWIGHRRLDCRRHPRPETVLPVLVEAGALADNVPHRQLMLSPDHAIFLDGALIPVKTLINGATIRQIERDDITYFHIELDHHAVLVAEGAPCESYLESGNRANFVNGGAPVALHPDFAQALREREGCAPFHETGLLVERVRARLLARAAIATTDEPDLTITLRADGSALIASRSTIPGHVTPDPRDCRRLGIKISGIHVGDAEIVLDHPDLVDGWYLPEPDGRWTNGAAIVPAHIVQGKPISVRLAATAPYPKTRENATRGPTARQTLSSRRPYRYISK